MSNKKGSHRKAFQVVINFHTPPAQEIKTMTTGEFYKFLTEYNNSNMISAVTIVKIDRK